LSFVTLPNRRRILEEIANNIAERKHTFLSVSTGQGYLDEKISKKKLFYTVSRLENILFLQKSQ
jgi:hypothetical protein